MIARRQLMDVKRELDNKIGQRIKLTSKKGKTRILIKDGILEETHPSLFVIRFEDPSGDGSKGINQMPVRRASFSYADILTKTIVIALIKE